MWMTCLDPGHEHLDADTKPIPTKASSTDFAASSPKSDGIISIGKLETPLEGVESLWDWRAPRLRGSQFWQFCPWIFWSSQQDLPSVREAFEIAKECATVKLRHLLFEVEGLQSGSTASVAFYDIPLDSPTSFR